MSDKPPADETKTVDDRIGRINIDDVLDWESPPVITEPTYDQKASLWVAVAVLAIFAVVYIFCFVAIICMMRREDSSFEGSAEMVKFMMTSILPLVTLAVGYYLGEKSSKGEL